MSDNVIDKRYEPFTIIPNCVIKSDKITKPIELVVYAVICMHANNTSKQSMLNVATIARTANSSDRVVRRAIKTLEDAGFIAVKKNYREDGGRKHNTYVILAIKG